MSWFPAELSVAAALICELSIEMMLLLILWFFVHSFTDAFIVYLCVYRFAHLGQNQHKVERNVDTKKLGAVISLWVNIFFLIYIYVCSVCVCSSVCVCVCVCVCDRVCVCIYMGYFYNIPRPPKVYIDK